MSECACCNSQLQGLGQIICTTALCAEGRAAVQQMMGTFTYLSNNPQFPKARFEATVHSIESAFDDQYTMFSEWIPFNPACCAIVDIGKSADNLTNQMLQSVAAVGLPPKPKLPVDPVSGALTLGTVLVVFLLAKELRK